MSVAAKWFLDDEEYVQEARALLSAFTTGSLALVVPDCFYYELAGLAIRAERRGRITAAQADRIAATVANMPLLREASGPFMAQALTRARAFKGSPYDAIYLLLAEKRGIPFVTADEVLYAKVGHLQHVRRLADVVQALLLPLT